MTNGLKKILEGYHLFRDKYATGDATVMQYLSHYGQEPEIMVVACCDSRVDPALILQCDPGDLFVVRNVANIVPPYEKDAMHHGTSAALEFGVCFLKVKHLILLGHSQCGGVQALLNKKNNFPNDFISNWVSLIESPQSESHQQDDQQDDYAKLALRKSYQNCLSFPWIRDKVKQHELQVHLWYFDIKSGQIFNFIDSENQFNPLM